MRHMRRFKRGAQGRHRHATGHPVRGGCCAERIVDIEHTPKRAVHFDTIKAAGDGIAGGMAVAWVLKQLTRSGRQSRPLMMELPSYHWPTVRNLALGLWQRAWIFLRRVGTVILLLTVALWWLASYPAAPAGAPAPAATETVTATRVALAT